MTPSKAAWIGGTSTEGEEQEEVVVVVRILEEGVVLGLNCALRMVCGGAKRRVEGAILALLDQTEDVVLVDLSSSEGGERSPYNPPSIFFCKTLLTEKWKKL